MPTHNLADKLQSFTHAQRERLAFIDFSLQFFGYVSRGDLIQRFQMGLAAGTRDLAIYRELLPDNLVLQHQTKQYFRTDAFTPLFTHEAEAVLTSLSRGFGNGISSPVQSSHLCFDAVSLVHPNGDIIASLMRAIHNQQAVTCEYVSLSSGRNMREIVPHSMVNNGHRWHVRAFDRTHNSFRDFVCTRFVAVEMIKAPIESHEGRGYDDMWLREVELHIVPHPSVEQSLAIEMDYAMVNGELKVKTKAALAAYILRQWQVDCSEGSRIVGQGCQLALANLEVLHNIESARLAPGCKV